ncbi:MAG: hypothetical protein A3A33_04520 [Candidatus Yanofskybacteria bacterium RIFCSPLOWO2_01_FULL_49_25]|uniref:Transcription elongation factor GreA n=1 Tax=Candidatus Yanofskybacteria bacterium RIFCSPLOWO2_01_FULL_49_25 TaxID=1802701 RepID=A0A1F8GWE8_9BACT|nr:MAG: hypothetical protein A3A33_04520 [Candidatus Yanofskybacteria bacterium RIFCSPLOWO2_01_FULL_49_25]
MTQYFSQEGLEKLKKELADREGELRGLIAKRILAAKEMGDLSENAEYAEAREEQGINEGRIEELKEILRTAVLISTNQKNEIIAVGATVMLKAGSAEREYTIVGASEADPIKGFISNETPLGAALIGRKKGEEIDVQIPNGKMKYKILKIK